MEFVLMDATEMTFENDYFDLIIDKGTLDCIFTDTSSFEKIISMLTVSIFIE